MRRYFGFLCFTLDLYSSPGLTSFYVQAGMLTGEGLGGVAQAMVSTPHLLMQFPRADTLVSFTFKVRHRCRLF